jgi:hypothetical protein
MAVPQPDAGAAMRKLTGNMSENLRKGRTKMRTMVIAVSLMALALVPAALQADGGLQSPYKDLDVEITVAEQAEIWHGVNLKSISLEVRDAMAWFGESIPMAMLANVPCDVFISVDAEAAAKIPTGVQLYIVTNENGKWDDDNYAKPIDGSTNRRFDRRYDWAGGEAPGWGLHGFQSTDPNSQHLVMTADGIPSTLVRALAGDRQQVTINNIYAAVADASGMAAVTTEPGVVTVVYTVTPPTP